MFLGNVEDKLSKKTLFIIKWVFFILIFITGASVLFSGYWYSFDNDEIINVQQTYLILKGFKPYLHFYSSYSSVFHWLISPIFLIKGFTIDGLWVLRLFMIVLFGIRLFFSFHLVKKIFGKIAAIFFIALTFLDPFVAMTAIQIRPDNLLYALYPGAMLLLLNSLRLFSPASFFLSGLVFGLLLLIQIKIVPGLVIAIIILSYYLIMVKKRGSLVFLFAGLFALPIIYCFFFLINGSLHQMLQQTLIDSVNLVQSIYNPLGFFYIPNNAYVYGVDGKPLSWVYVWILPLMAAIGSYLALTDIIGKRISKNNSLIGLVLIFTLWTGWFSLFYINAVFIQYYIAFTLFAPMMAGYFIYRFLFINLAVFERKIYLSIIGFFFLMYVFFSLSSIRGNIAHAKLSYLFNPTRDKLEYYWAIIPENSRVFPCVLYRPIAYPMICGYGLDINRYPSSIKNKVPLFVDTLETNRVDYIVADDMGLFSAIDSRFSNYLSLSFDRIKNTNIYKRRVSK